MSRSDLPDTPEDELDRVSPPGAPGGYQDPYRFEYPKLVLFVSAVLLTVGSVIVYGRLLVRLQGPDVLPVVFEVGDQGEFAVVFTLGELAIPFVVSFVSVAVIHELIHGVVYERYGYEVSYGVYWSLGAVYAAVFQQFHSREDNLRVGIAPLAVITVVCLPLLAVPHPLMATTAFFVLVLNTAGGVGDIYALQRFYRLPPGTVFYDITIHHMYVYEPK